MLSPRAQRRVIALAALLGVLLTARLGWWQLDRAAQKEALRQAVETAAALPPLATEALARTPGEAAAQRHRQVRVQGRWLPQFTVFLDNRQMDGRPGFFVLTPLALADGSAVLVQRGWVPRDARERTRLPAIPAPTAPVDILARAAGEPARLYDPGRSADAAAARGLIRQNLSLDDFARETGLRLRPLTLLQLDEAAPAAAAAPSADGLHRRWPLPAADVHKHHGYAFQWFALAALITVLYVWFQLLRPRRSARR